MSGTKDKLGGRIKEAAGALSDDDELRREGRNDQHVGGVKDKLHKAADKAGDLLDKGRDKIRH